jgi:tetratricopeptide (TPR) repeat protein
VRTAKLGADHLDALDALNLLAWLHQESGQLAQALELFEKVHTVRAARLGADDLNTIMSLHNLAWACMRVGRASRAVELLQKVRDVQAAKLGGDHPDTLVTLHNLALAYRDDGQAPRAIELFEKTHGLQTGRLGAEHPQTLITLHNLACAYVRTGHPERAIPAFEDVLNRQEGKLGRQHPHTLMSLNWLASAYNDAGQYTKARERAEEALARLRADRVPEQLDALGTFRVLAGVLRDRGNLAGSIEVNRLLLEAFRRKVGRVDRTTIDTENHLGLALVMDGRYPEAEAHLLASYRNLPQAANVPAGWKSLYALRLACLYTEWGKPASVARWQDEVRSLVGQYSRPLVGTGLEMFQAARFRAAELAFRECLTIRERTEPDAWPTFNARSLLGGSLLAQGKYTEAEPLLLKGYEGMKAREKTIPPQATTRVPEALDRLIDLYTATGKPDEAKKWRAERAKYPFVAPPPRAVR